MVLCIYLVILYSSLILEVKILVFLVILGPLLCVSLPMSTLTAVEVLINGRGRGEWYLPDGTRILSTPLTNFYRTRYTQQVRLSHRNNAMSPTGVFTCVVPNDGYSTMPFTATITIGECNDLLALH